MARTTHTKRLRRGRQRPSDPTNFNINDTVTSNIHDANEIKDIKPWYSNREDIPIIGQCTYDTTSSGNDILNVNGISCECDDTGGYPPIDFESNYLISFGSTDNIDNDCCNPSLYDWYNTLSMEEHLPCSSPMIGNSQCDYISGEGIKRIDPYGERFFITLRGNSAFTGEIDCGSGHHWMWIEQWCLGDYTSTDCITSSPTFNQKQKIADVCPPPCTTPGDDTSCSEITIWIGSIPNYRDDVRSCDFRIHSYYNWEGQVTPNPDEQLRNEGPYLSFPLHQDGGAEKISSVPGACPPHIACPQGQWWVDWPTCECQDVFQPWQSCQDPFACNYNPNGVSPCEDCCMYFVCPDGTCARTSMDCPDFMNPGCTNPEACNYCPPFFQDENGTPCEELAGPTWNQSGTQTCPCTPEPEVCQFSDDLFGETCDCFGNPFGDYCTCDSTVPYAWCPDEDGDGLGSCVGVTPPCPVIACIDEEPEGWVNNCWDPCDHPNGNDCSGECGGTAVYDSCGVCGGTCFLPDDCNGACNCDGDTTYDSCGVCGGNGGTIQCWDGSFVCTADQCIETEQGCTDSSACNYSASAINDDGSCFYPSGCDNICGSTLEFDDCGVCGGNSSTCCPGGCAQPTPDCVDGSCECTAGNTGCDNVCGSDLVVDDCGICGGDNSSCEDCAGTPNGTWYPDCNGDCCNPEVSVGESMCKVEDCAGVCGGTSVEDACGVCGGDNSTCLDECGVPNGDNSLCTDECDVVNGDNSTCLDECGVPNGSGIAEGECDCAGHTLDECGVCNGDGTSCADCAGVSNGNSIEYTCGYGEASSFPCGGGPYCSADVEDNCSIIANGTCDCDGTLPSGCDNQCGSTAVVDECGVCGGDNSTCEDCAGTPNGSASLDCAGECNGSSIQDCDGNCYDPDSGGTPTAVEDCLGECLGEAYVDCLGDCNGDAFDCGGVCVSADTICGCTDNTALNYNPDATADDGSCYLMDCANFSSCDEYCSDGSTYCTTPDEIDTFCYTNNEFPAIYIQAGDFQYVSYTIPIIDGIQSYSLSDILNNSLYENNPDEGTSSLQTWSQGTAVFASVNYDEGDLYTGIATFSSDGSWTGTLTTLDVSAGYYIKSYGSGWLKWTLPVT